MQSDIKFKYNPNLNDLGILVKGNAVCDCCRKEIDLYYPTMYCRENVKAICLNCIHDGRAAAKFNGSFVQDAETNKVSDQKKTAELFLRTPGYISWQGEHWLACCDDYCAYLGEVGIKELEELGIAEEVISECETRNEYEGIREYLFKGGSMNGYLFQCLHCNKYQLWVDAD